MALTYCFESSYIPSVLSKCRKNDLAVVETQGYESADDLGCRLSNPRKPYFLIRFMNHNILKLKMSKQLNHSCDHYSS